MIRQQSWLGDLLASLFMAAGCSEALFILLGFDPSALITVLLTIPCLALVSLIYRRWLLSLTVLLTVVSLAALILYRVDRLELVWNSINHYFAWSWTWLQLGLPEPPDSSWLLMLKLALLLPLCAVMFLLVRKTGSLLLFFLLQLAFFVPVVSAAPNASTSLLLAASGLVILMPRTFLRKIEKKTGAPPLKRTPLQLLATVFALLSLLAAVIAVPASTASWKLQPLANQLADFSDLLQNSLQQGRAYNTFSIGDYGFMPAGSRLGGSVILKDSSVLKVETQQGGLLKGSSYMIYTGSSWQHGQTNQYRLDSALWKQLRLQVFGNNLPRNEGFINAYIQDITLTIRHQKSGLSSLFTQGRVQTVQSKQQFNLQPYFSTSGDLFVFGQLPIGAVYEVKTQVVDSSAEQFDPFMQQIASAASDSIDSSWLLYNQQYLQLPENMPEIIAETANNVVGQTNSPYGRALLIKSYFQTGFEYSLNPRDYTASEDFAASFLETKSGYCVHYATAMVMMARTLGIPARYVEGFILVPESDDPDNMIYLATGNSAHAWAELYFQGIGWLAFDPTPGNSITDSNQPTPSPAPQITEIPEPTDSAVPSPAQSDSPTQSDNRSLASWFVPLSLLFLLVVWKILPAFLIRHHKRLFSNSWITQHNPELSDQLDFYYLDCLRQLACLGIVPEIGETIFLFSERANRRLKFEALDISHVFWPVMAWRYGEQPPVKQDISEIESLHNRLEDQVLARLGSRRYLFKRVLGLTRRLGKQAGY